MTEFRVQLELRNHHVIKFNRLAGEFCNKHFAEKGKQKMHFVCEVVWQSALQRLLEENIITVIHKEEAWRIFYLRRHFEIKPKKLTLSPKPNLNPNPSPNPKPNLNPNPNPNPNL